MKSTARNGALDAYRQVGLHSGANGADPHQLVCMLMDGALERVALAKGALQRGDVAARGTLIGQAMTIVDGLNGCLDSAAGGELAVNLGGLYDYMLRRLLQANRGADPGALDEVATLLGEIREAWVAIPSPVRVEHAAVAGARV